ncbi:hypothetical protein L1987_72619 [Smallanthus sonchifolius]|uniref:Uncharacterized protein n=1 Tax=Smallanthus sonchifolius TaxID=185202 RepID=A0ACB9AUT1_9ASTR|nr:hypothetical protein L1987_72619 [Smallanthus sonchifolius]
MIRTERMEMKTWKKKMMMVRISFAFCTTTFVLFAFCNGRFGFTLGGTLGDGSVVFHRYAFHTKDQSQDILPWLATDPDAQAIVPIPEGDQLSSVVVSSRQNDPSELFRLRTLESKTRGISDR